MVPRKYEARKEMDRRNAVQPTSELEKEHENIRRMLEVVREMIRRLEAGDPVEADDVQAAIDFIREYADSSHHAKEEEILFLGHGRSRLPPGGWSGGSDAGRARRGARLRNLHGRGFAAVPGG